MITIPCDPANCARYILEVHGARGSAWLERLPAILAECAARWSLTILEPFPDLSYNYVAPAVTAGGESVVLKACVPNPELYQEAEALRLFAGRSMVRLFDADLERGVLLLERFLPGTSLSEVDDDAEVTQIAVEVARDLWVPAPAQHSLTSLVRWARGFDRLHAAFPNGYGPFPGDLVDRAENIFRDYVLAANEHYVIHGDLHPGNILRSRDSWRAIDPKGVVGDPRWDVATLINSGLTSTSMLARRLEQVVTALDASPASIRTWGFAQAVLSAWWSYEDHGCGYEPALAVARLYDALE